jgi:lauroyl/myristoyl acyltransferase
VSTIKGDAEVPDKNVKFKMPLLHPRYIVSWLWLLVAVVLSLLPRSARHALGDGIGAYLYRNNQKRKVVVEKNLRQVFPNASESELQEKVRSHLGWYGKALVDYCLFFFGSKNRLKSLVSIGNEKLLADIGNDQPVILMLAHSVMLEFAAVALSNNYKSFGSYKPSTNPVFDWMIARSRCRFADFVVSRDEGLRPLIRAIKSKRIMIFLPDEDLGLDNAVFAPFFNRDKATLTTPARLSKLGGAKAVAGFVVFDESTSQYQLKLEAMPSDYPSGDSGVDASALNGALERLVMKSPEQYLWVMKFFRTTPPENRPFY